MSLPNPALPFPLLAPLWLPRISGLLSSAGTAAGFIQDRRRQPINLGLTSQAFRLSRQGPRTRVVKEKTRPNPGILKPSLNGNLSFLIPEMQPEIKFQNKKKNFQFKSVLVIYREDM